MLTGNQPSADRRGSNACDEHGFPRLLLLAPLAGCDTVVLSPSGYIAAQQRDLLLSSTLLMLLIVIPVMGLTAFFAWRYSEKRSSRYDPDWHHSTSLELVIWAAPLMIIICLGAITWTGTHLLDPFRPLEQHRRAPAGAGGRRRRSRCRWWRSTGSGSSSTRSTASPRVNDVAVAGRPAGPLPPDLRSR